MIHIQIPPPKPSVRWCRKHRRWLAVMPKYALVEEPYGHHADFREEWRL